MLEKTLKVGRVQLKNGLVMAPADLQKSNCGTVSEEQLNYYDERTKGGYVGLVIIEHSFIRADGRASENQLSCAKDADIDGLSKLADVIHKNGSKAVMQLSHAGLKSVRSEDGLEGISPSGTVDIADSTKFRHTHAITKDEMDVLTDAWREAACRVKRAGFDGVELHAAHGYLLNQFYSPLTNHRTDAYNGQTIEGRVKLHQELISAVREVLGPNLLLGIRFGACDYMDGGSSIEDGAKAAQFIEKAGADFIDISGGMCGPRPAGRDGVGYFRDSSFAVKKIVSVPVITAGGVKTRQDAENLLSDGAADLIGVARAIVADPSWAQKAFS